MTKKRHSVAFHYTSLLNFVVDWSIENYVYPQNEMHSIMNLCVYISYPER